MKTIILISVMFFASITLSAQDKGQNFLLGFTTVEVFNKEIVPALSVEIKSKSLNAFDFMIAYANNFFTKNKLQRPTQIQNHEIQNIYLAMNYRF